MTCPGCGGPNIQTLLVIDPEASELSLECLDCHERFDVEALEVDLDEIEGEVQ